MCRLTLAAALLAVFTVKAQGQGWEAIQEGNVLLSVRDSQAPGGYQARVTVIAPDGTAYAATITVKGSAWGMVVFPDDFATKAQAGASPGRARLPARQSHPRGLPSDIRGAKVFP
jgi:hypothetical protein